MSTPPRTTKEALFAEMLGDMDAMISRIEKLPELVEGCEQRLRGAAAILESAGEQYGQVVTDFTEQTKVELTGFLDQQAAMSIEKGAASICKIDGSTLLPGAKDITQVTGEKRLFRLLEHGATAMLASLLMFFLMRLDF